MKVLGLLLALVLVLLVPGCASTAPPEDERDFHVGAERYKLTREHGGTSRWLLWRQEGISWRLVSETPATP